MPWSCERVNFDPLKPAATEEEYALHLAAVEWSLAEPIVIAGKEDIKSQAKWRDGFEPYHHQIENLIRFCRMLPVTLLADDVGLGKTISAGLILAELMERKRVSRALVMCPTILGPQWVEELDSKFGIRAKFARGQELDDQLRRPSVSVIVTTYQSASNRLETISRDAFDMLIMDEAHKLRNLHGTQSPPKMAERARNALKSRLFKYVLMLTATPIQNRVWDLYSLIDLLTVAKGHLNPFGEPDEFERKFIADKAGRQLKPWFAEEFRSILREYLVRTRREDSRLKFPTRRVETRRLPPGAIEQRMVTTVADHIAGLHSFTQVQIGQAMMSSPQALATQLENMATKGTIRPVVAQEMRRLADQNPSTAKLDGLVSLIQELKDRRPRDWRVVVFTLRLETQEAIGRTLSELGISVGFIRGANPRGNQSTIERFRASPPKINVIVSTDAGAEGVNLQAGNVLVNYDLPWNPMVVEQRIGRIQRLASTHENVNVINLAIAGSVEARVVARLNEKLQVISETIGDIEGILASTGQDEDDSFQEMIRKLVVSSLTGQNIEEAARAIEASIELGRTRMKEEAQVLDQQLGPDSFAPDSDATPPKLEPVVPTIPFEDFVRRALVAEGATLHDNDDATIDVRRTGRAVERITFDEEVAEEASQAVFMGNPPRLYRPGRPAFERLVQRWLDRSAHSVRELRSNLDGLTNLAASRWCESVPDAEFEFYRTIESVDILSGEIVCRAKASNGVDSLEKLIRLSAGQKLHSSMTEAAIGPFEISTTDVNSKAVFQNPDSVIEPKIVGDPDIHAFCEFYDGRMAEELSKAGSELRLRRRIENDFLPKVFADVVAACGVRYEVILANIAIKIDGDNRYEIAVRLLPASGAVLAEPDRVQCSITGRELPMPCIRTCEVSGLPATAHLLGRSAESGRYAKREYFFQCGVTGDQVLPDEVLKSDLSGRQAKSSLFDQSPVSGRRGLTDEFALCELTGSRVLNDEIETSQVSGLRFRADQAGTSVLSGTLGHCSEFVTCSATGELILPVESGVSDVSGRIVRKDLLVASEKPPHRHGLKDETTRCAVTGLLLLTDEAAISEVSGQVIDLDRVARSDKSGRIAFPSELVHCEETGQVLLPDEVSPSVVSGKRVRTDLLVASPISGRKALPTEFVTCELTGAHILPDELAESEESGLYFRKDEAVASAESGRIGHRSESVICQKSKNVILKSEAAASAMSGGSYSRRILISSEKASGRLGLASETVVCAKSRKRMLQDEVIESAVSGKVVDRDLVIPSSRSGRVALREELISCAESGRLLLPDECGTCSILRKPVDNELLAPSDLSGKLGVRTKLVTCAVTGKSALPGELHRCEITGQMVDPNELETCFVSKQRAVKHLFVKSCISDVPILRDCAVWSPLTKRCCAPSEAGKCHWNGVSIPRDELVACRLTGLTFHRSLINPSNEFTIIRGLLNGHPEPDASDLLGWLSSASPVLKGAKSAIGTFSPDGAVRAVCCEVRGMLGMKVRYVGLIVQESQPRRVLGRVVVGKRKDGSWQAEQ